MSIHQGAQTDRASIALNYSRISFNFIEPRVMETATKDGITPCEFPIINYSVAVLYKAFGPNPFWYRFLMWCLMGFGLWAAFDLLCLWLANKWAALIISFTWFFSPILNFYTPNFLPDTASLAFMLLALRQWFYYNYDTPKGWRIAWFTLFAAIGCLIKITSLIFIIAIVSINIILFLKTFKRPRFIGAAIFIFLSVFSWYYYCRWLEYTVGGSYFLMNPAFPSSLAQLKEWFGVFYANWFHQIYTYPQWIFIGFGLVSIPFIKEKLFLKLFVCFALAGSVCIYLLMAGQFQYHDYYSITLLPVCLFLMAFGYKWLVNKKPVMTYIVLLLFCIWGFIEVKSNFRLRYTPSHYLYQTFFEPKDFVGVDQWLTQNGVTQNDKVLAAFDRNPNIMLYFLNRRGCRTFDHTQSYATGKIKLYHNMVTNDTLQFFKQYPLCRNQIYLKSSFKKWHLYKEK